jgi:hypothetical protein
MQGQFLLFNDDFTTPGLALPEYISSTNEYMVFTENSAIYKWKSLSAISLSEFPMLSGNYLSANSLDNLSR